MPKVSIGYQPQPSGNVPAAGSGTPSRDGGPSFARKCLRLRLHRSGAKAMLIAKRAD
jgi:hypothetical protein